MIQIKNEKVIINGKEIILFGGELHYFRLQQYEWKNRIKQIKAAGANMVSTYIPWQFHEKTEGEIDLTGKSRPEKDLRAFIQMIQDENMYCLVRPGPYVMAEIVDHGVPSWLIDNYEEALAKNEKGESHPVRLVSYMHPIYLEKTEKWYKHVCDIIAPLQVTNGGPVIMFQLDNEVGMFHWVTNQGDYNDVTLKYFQAHLEQKYTLKEFHTVFTDEVSSIEEFVQKNVKKVEEGFSFALQNEYSLFMREHYRTYIEKLKEFAEKNHISVPFVVNIHGFDTVGGILKRGMKYPIGISQLIETTKIENVMIAGDYYIGNLEYDNYSDVIIANAFTRSVQSKDQPLFSAEFQGGCITDKPRLQPSAFDLITRLSFANGMNAVNYYMFVSGENYEDIGLFGKRHEWQAPLSANGKERAHYKPIQHLGKMFQVYNDELLKTKPEYNTHLAFYPDYFMTEFHNEYTQGMMREIEQWREAFLFNGIAKGFTINNIAYDGYNLLESSEIDVKRIPSLWVFSTKWMDETIQEKLVNYVKNGGNLIIFPTLPTETMKRIPCTILKDFIEVEQKEIKHGFAIVEDMENIAAMMQTYGQIEGAFAWTEDDEKDVVAFEKNCGDGKVVIIGLGMEVQFDYQLEALKKITDKLGIYSSFSFDDHIEALDAFSRISEKNGKFLFLHNFDEYEKETTITFAGKQLFRGKKITIPSRSGLMLPIQVNLTEDIFIEYGSGEIFEIERKDDELKVNVKIMQDEEFLFISSKWIPQESNWIQVEQIESNQYIVKICTTEKVAELKFVKSI
ncbi:beta-galactosidase [Bacillus sp. AFS041924]|uniref:beta-galactosidase n=1 Tax=Bacillus sp. AFS041924 TaxID=2033503 RepID=UPI000BFBC930|nr:beta-galactosidase [Bacillus sp. AFS041924]PGS48761.1 beta-galactosidase [Bacillus sp. AFS041924]